MKASIKYSLTALMLFCFSGLHAQFENHNPFITMGAEGELTTASVKISGVGQSFINSINGKNIMGYEIGPYFKINAGLLYIKPKVLFSYQSGIVQTSYSDESSANVTMSVFKLEVPVLVGIRILGPLSLEAGPVYDRLITATKDYNGNSVDIAPDGLGYRIGANIQLGIIGLNAAYEGIKNSGSAMSSFSSPDELVFGASIRF